MASTAGSGRRWAWCVFWTLATACCCSGGRVVTHDAAPGFTAGGACCVATPHHGEHGGTDPVALPPLAEAEIVEDDVEPREPSSRSWPVPEIAWRVAARVAVARRPDHGMDPAVLVVNAADLSRLCRLLC